MTNGKQGGFMVGQDHGLDGKGTTSIRRKALIDVLLSVGGLAAVFAGIAIFNVLISWLHWR